MNTRYMEFFLKTVDMGSINAASQALYISPQGLSQALQQVEKELGEKLFFRQGNRLHLTAAGEIAYETYKQIVTLNDELTDRVNYVRADGHRSGRRIDVVAAPIIAATCLPKILTTFRQRNPDARIRVTEVAPEEFFEIIDFGVDTIGIVALPTTMQQSFFRSVPEFVDVITPYTCYQEVSVSVRSPLSGRAKMTVRDMEKGRVMLFGGDIRMLNHLPEGFDESSVAVKTRNIVLCRSLVAAEKNTFGFTNRFVEYYLKTPGLVSVPFTPEIEVAYGYVVNRDSENPLVKDFRDVLEGELELVRKANE